jgi:hypothetical protein
VIVNKNAIIDLRRKGYTIATMRMHTIPDADSITLFPGQETPWSIERLPGKRRGWLVVASDASPEAVEAVLTPPRKLDAEYIGSGESGRVVRIGDVALKRFSGPQPDWIAGLPSIAANVGLAEGLERTDTMVDGYNVTAPKVHAAFLPDGIFRSPTWAMDYIQGEPVGVNGRCPIPEPKLRWGAYDQALRTVGINTSSVNLDDGFTNLIAQYDAGGAAPTLFKLDVMAIHNELERLYI